MSNIQFDENGTHLLCFCNMLIQCKFIYEETADKLWNKERQACHMLEPRHSKISIHLNLATG